MIAKRNLPRDSYSEISILDEVKHISKIQKLIKNMHVSNNVNDDWVNIH